jgi:long-chain acyl-CoA synthetase
VGIPDKIMDYTIVAFIIPNDTNIDINDIKEFCRINLIPYKIPEKFLVVDTFPTTSVGKIQKYKLIEEYL